MLRTISATLLFYGLLIATPAGAADLDSIAISSADSNKADVYMVETEDERCVANDGKLVSLEAKNLTASIVVWVDRWFMDVQTADHTKQILSKDANQAALGCSNTYSGRQHWTIYSVNPL